MQLTATDVRAALHGHRRRDLPALPGRTNHRGCGVLVPITTTGSPEVLLTVRAAALSHHGGEVSFPGGKPDAADLDLQQTALREAREELGLADVEVIGELSSMPLYTSDYRLHPYVGLVDIAQVRPNPAEVAEVIRLPLARLLQRTRVDAIPFEYEGKTQLSPVFAAGPHVIYGGTAHTLWELVLAVARVLDRAPPALAPGRWSWRDLLPAAFSGGTSSSHAAVQVASGPPLEEA